MRLLFLSAALAATAAHGGETLEARVLAELERQGLGADALGLIDNIVRHEAPAPPAAPPFLRELLGRPLEAADAESLFRRTVPPVLLVLGESETNVRFHFDFALQAYIDELAEAQRLLRAATRGAAINVPRDAQPSPDALLSVARTVDVAGIERASALFLEATARFIRALKPHDVEKRASFASAIGPIVFGSPGNDRHPPGAALILDPGGDDVYEAAPAEAGTVAVIVDLAGNDRYIGAAAAFGGLAAVADFAGDDRYEAEGPGQGAAIAGAALLVDFSGDDRYEAGVFAQGAAAFGVGALLDLAGSDAYRLHAWGQGLGMAAGLGLLWDRDGDDRYAASGVPDFYERGAGLSGAQGVGWGFRTSLGGGVGLLRDEQGADHYEAEMFAQGSGFYYGAGFLWDGGGNDHYRAVRYAQGNGAHEAIGTLRDESGHDAYHLGFGVGQGMGLDVAVGVLLDAGGDDRYEARVFAQGTATANGIGLLYDPRGADHLQVEHVGAWGAAEPLRGLPSVGLFLHHSQRPRSAALPGPQASRSCENEKLEDLEKEIAALDPERFAKLLAVGTALRCALADGEHWDTAERLLAEDPQTPLAGPIASALAHAPEARRAKILDRLRDHPRCAVHALALQSLPRIDAARAAAASTCWRLQAVALEVLRRAGEKPPRQVSLPQFLRGRPAY